MQIKNKGFSLIEILVALGIFSFVSLAFASFMSQTAREFRAANQKTEMISFERDLEMVLRLDMGSCSAIVQGHTFNRGGITETSGPVIPLPNGLFNGDGTVLAAPNELLMGTSTGLRVARTELEVTRELPPPNNHVYQGTLRVAMDPDSTVRSFVPTSSQIWLEVDPASPAGSRQIQGCSPAIIASPCAEGEIQVGTGTGEALCTDMTQLIAEAMQQLSCPPDTVLGGVNPDGTPDCRPMADAGTAPPTPTGDGQLESTTKRCSTSGRRSCEVHCDPGWTRSACTAQTIGESGCQASPNCGARTCMRTTAVLTCIRQN